MQVRLRSATLDDLQQLQAWDREPAVVASSGDDGDFDWRYELPRQVSWRELLIAEADGVPIGVMQIIDPRHEETHYWGEVPEGLRAIDIWIGEPAYRGRGLGSEMMRLAHQRCFAATDVTAIIIDPLASNERAIRFYQRLGYRPVDRRLFADVDDCVVMQLDRERAGR